LKVVIDPTSECVLGARVMGAAAGELIHVYVALMGRASRRGFWWTRRWSIRRSPKDCSPCC
ncbi:MAG TPA: hypothetical protein VFH73_21070, partial [Polyangia bacterium]|nr:hypothetical protein [Polyangia bacterium]